MVARAIQGLFLGGSRGVLDLVLMLSLWGFRVIFGGVSNISNINNIKKLSRSGGIIVLLVYCLARVKK